jgi:fructokinase
MKRKIISIGECLIDFLPNEKGLPLEEVNCFKRKAGGAPANVACCVAKLGGLSYFIGKFSNDSFGSFLIKSLKNVGVKTDFISITNKAKTALAFVSLKKDGDREFSFYRNPSADMLLNESEIQKDWFSEGDILHFCSVDLIEAPVKYAHIKAIEYCIENDGLISFDVNIRFSLWHNEIDCITEIKNFLKFADLVKVSEEELFIITNISNEKDAVKEMFNLSKRAKLIFVTKGDEGVAVYDINMNYLHQNSVKVNVVDTTGAGDTFIGCVLYKLLELNTISLKEIKDVLKFACIGAGITVSKKGAIDAMPDLNEISDFKLI